jgi:hypothetical protein
MLLRGKNLQLCPVQQLYSISTLSTLHLGKKYESHS